MVWPFKRKKVIDFTDKNLVFMRKQRPMTTGPISAGEYADLTNTHSSSTNSVSTPMTPTSDDSDGVAGFGNFFAAAAESAGTSTSSTPTNLEIQGLKNKHEDLEYKMNNLMRKLNALLDRFEVVEKKVERGLI